MKFDRKRIFRLHSWIGIKLSILFFIVCLSGTLATLSHEMDWLFNPAVRAAPQETLAFRNVIAAHVYAVFPEGSITYWETVEEPYLCNILHVQIDGQRHYVFANPYTGVVQGSATLPFSGSSVICTTSCLFRFRSDTLRC